MLRLHFCLFRYSTSTFK